MFLFNRQSPLLALCAFSAAFITPVFADEALDEIVVRADLRERVLADVPASVSVMGREMVEQAAVQNFEELSFLVPNLNFAGGSNRARYFQLRGIGERSQYEGAPNPSVGFVIDDIDFSGIGGIAGTWDVESVEVLRGPQATRYGANALAGMIYVTSVAPSDTFEARARASVADDGMRSLAMAVGGPLSERVAYRLSAQHYQSDGFRNNVFLQREDTNDRAEDQLRARLAWQASETSDVDFTLLYADHDNGYDAFALDNGYATYSDRPGRDSQSTLAAGMRITHTPNERWSLRSVTGLANSDIEFSYDADWGNDPYWADFFNAPASAPFAPQYNYFSRRDRQRDTINQEFRLSSGPEGRLWSDTTHWLVGAYFLRLEESLNTYDDGTYTDGTYAPFFEVSESASDYSANKMAAFAQLDIDSGANTQFSLGLRVEQRNADYEDDAGLSLSPSESAVGGHLSMTHHFGEALSGFVALNRGYKMGGFNLGAVPAGRREFDAEYLWNLEAAMRWQGERWQSSVTAFFARRDDQQVDTSFQLVPNDPSTFVFFQDNAAQGRNVGLEFELRAQLSAQFSAYANVGLLRVEFDEFVTAEVDLSGREQAHAPGYSFAVGASWQHPRGWFARVDVNGKDAFYYSNSHDQRSSAYELVNTRLGFEREQWSVAMFARNLTDEQYAQRGFYFGNEPPVFADTLYLRLGDPRQIGVSVDWRY